MLANPQPGARVRVHYRKAIAEIMPHHGKTGTVVVACKGRPRNHGVLLDDGTLTAIPCGNLAKLPDTLWACLLCGRQGSFPSSACGECNGPMADMPAPHPIFEQWAEDFLRNAASDR